MRLRSFLPVALLGGALFFAAGCERTDALPFTAEIDEPSYRRGKELLKQGRNQEALSEFQKVIEKRGLLNAPEAHLELGLLYQGHIRDPIQAIYHFRKYRELKPSTQQADLVRGRIDLAMREFAATLPGKPLENPLTAADNFDVMQRLQRENAQLRAALSSARVAAGLSSRPPVDAEGRITGVAPEEMPAQEPSPISATSPVASGEELSVVRPSIESAAEVEAVSPVVVTSPTRPAAAPPPSRFMPNNAPAPASSRPANVVASAPRGAPPVAARRHTVRQGEGLYTIARRYYGTASNAQAEAIFQANRDKMKHMGDLRVGMELRIP
jgi:tetratricopeptide (TPR) repeat protein